MKEKTEQTSGWSSHQRVGLQRGSIRQTSHLMMTGVKDNTKYMSTGLIKIASELRKVNDRHGLQVLRRQLSSHCFIKWGKMSFCSYKGSYPGLPVCSSAHWFYHRFKKPQEALHCSLWPFFVSIVYQEHCITFLEKTQWDIFTFWCLGDI